MIKIPIGISDFKTLHDAQCYFVGKSLLIDEYDSPIHASYSNQYYPQNGYLAEFKQAHIQTVLQLGIAFSGKQVACVAIQKTLENP